MKFILIVIAVAVILFLVNAARNKKQSNVVKSVDKIAEPEEWPRLQKMLEKSALPSIKISLVDDEIKFPHQSKFGGKPYWPRNQAYPIDKEGEPLNFIAQINFSEVPDGVDGYPKSGLLQFFIANDDLHGLEFLDEKNTLDAYLNSKKNFSVVYHPDVGESVDVFSEDINKALNDDRSPSSGESAIAFTVVNDITSPMDYRFEKITQPFGPLGDALEEYAYEALIKSPDHKLGGYASFTQEDPRGYYAPEGNWLVLFQMDTDSNDNFDIMWGDVGIANFFIREEDLINLNFEKVWYNWDCH